MSVTRRALQGSARRSSAWAPASSRNLLCCRSFASSSARQQPEPESTQPSSTDQSNEPRWTHTPEQMRAPFSLHDLRDKPRWKVNEDPEKLDRMYEKLIGRDLTRSLPEDLKWLAVTHKSFDNGRRGFNTRLAFFGRMIVALETTRSIMGSQVPAEGHPADPHGRTPFSHPALDNVDKLNLVQPHTFSDPEKIAVLCREVGLLGVIQWLPRLPGNLEASGVNVVLNTTLFAIIGAISLHHGAEVANRTVRERILSKLA